MNGAFNQQGRKSGGYRKLKITVLSGNKLEGMMESAQKISALSSLPCRENRHKDCDGYLTFMPRKTINQCICNCHGENL